MIPCLPTEPDTVLSIREPVGSALGRSTDEWRLCRTCGAQGGIEAFYERDRHLCKICRRASVKARAEEIRSGDGPAVVRRWPIRERLLRTVQKMPNGCWLWTGWINPSDGYGYPTIDGRKTPAHRAMYEEFVGPIPEGLDADHQCHNLDLSSLLVRPRPPAPGPAVVDTVCPAVDWLSGAKCTLKPGHGCDHADVDQDFEIRWPRG